MNFLKKLFGSPNSESHESLPSGIQSSILWPEKFFLFVGLELSEEIPSKEDIREILSALFPPKSEEELQQLIKSLTTAAIETTDSKESWNRFWDNYMSQIKHLKLSENFSIMQELARVSITLKMLEGIERLTELFDYRASQLEEYCILSKQDIREIFLDARNNLANEDYIQQQSQEPTSDRKHQTTVISDQTPHYLVEAMEELDKAKRECKKHFDVFSKNIEELIKRANISGNEKELLKKNIGHGTHQNFDQINIESLSKTITKYMFSLEMSFKGKLKDSETAFVHAKKKFDTAAHKLDRINQKKR
jgi:hypothetical protein